MLTLNTFILLKLFIEGGALFIGVGPRAGVALGLTAYADFFILRMGMFVEGTLFEGFFEFKLGI